MDTQARAQVTKASLWLRLALGVSLALNLLIAGIFIGGALNGASAGRPQADDAGRRFLRETGLGPFIAAFPGETRRQMGQSLRQRIGPARAERAALIGELGEMLAILRADPFDSVALAAVMDRQTARIVSRTEAGRDVVVATLAAMQPDQRAQFADALEQSLREAEARAADRAASRQ